MKCLQTAIKRTLCRSDQLHTVAKCAGTDQAWPSRFTASLECHWYHNTPLATRCAVIVTGWEAATLCRSIAASCLLFANLLWSCNASWSRDAGGVEFSLDDFLLMHEVVQKRVVTVGWALAPLWLIPCLTCCCSDQRPGGIVGGTLAGHFCSYCGLLTFSLLRRCLLVLKQEVSSFWLGMILWPALRNLLMWKDLFHVRH